MYLRIYAALGLIAGLAAGAYAAEPAAPAKTANDASHIEVTADKSLEWYQEQHLYAARGNAKAVRGDMTVEADLLTAHERETPKKTDDNQPAPPQATQSAEKPAGGTGDLDKMTGEGNVRVTTPTVHIIGDKAVYDLDQHVAYMTGDNLKYETGQETVTAKKSLEYWEEKKLAVARGNAVGVRGERHVEGDVLTAQFREMPNGKTELHTMTAEGNVVILTKKDTARSERAVYDANRNIAVLTGNVRITRPDGTQLTGDVGEVDFATNQSRLLNEGKGRVRALLTSKAAPKTSNGAVKPASASASVMAPIQ